MTLLVAGSLRRAAAFASFCKADERNAAHAPSSENAMPPDPGPTLNSWTFSSSRRFR